MKKHITILSVLLAASATIYFAGVQTGNTRSSGGNGIAGVSGSPFDGTDCTNGGGCHPGPTNQTPASWVTSTVPKTGYIPGATYTVTVKAVNKTSGQNSNFGFEFTPQDQTTGNVVGTLANIKTSGAGSTTIASSEWITHTSGSYQSTDSNTWSFKWTAPSPGVGAVNWYCDFNTGSGDNQGSAQIWQDSGHFIQASTVGANEVASASNELKVFPNPAKTDFTVNYTLQQDAQVEVNLYSIDGQKVASLLDNTQQTAGEHNQMLHIPFTPSGIYLLQLVENGQSTCKRVIVE